MKNILIALSLMSLATLSACFGPCRKKEEAARVEVPVAPAPAPEAPAMPAPAPETTPK